MSHQPLTIDQVRAARELMEAEILLAVREAFTKFHEKTQLYPYAIHVDLSRVDPVGSATICVPSRVSVDLRV